MISYRNRVACFKIQNESEGISLLNCKGEDNQAPPESITLVKGIRNWTGRIEDEVLLSELGKFIDAHWPFSGRCLLVES